ncbi:hypothetical protein MesoLjLc_28980 [Mesorhizobium sp. L-8-10]|uniref:hypothetical protein n=1 Tax=Mesorhizobium sp. L-8-10 TaxID=2744523 RepID=UPI001927E870|nr:hypothetical protein [Mesorhizobium sp. L-8-10]BCH30968.1 hypothetical protein MesoLjLc_28980 [Mesorhizobium sp. L-8-10]
MWPRRAKAAATGPADVGAARRASKKGRLREDLLLGLFGVALGLGCALFPWYVFFNQEKFGVRAVQFEGGGDKGGGGGVVATPQIARIPDFPEVKEEPELDQLATGTTPPDEEAGDETAKLLELPFPPQHVPFQLVYVANGRAMIQDDTGIWVVQRGSVLPDMSRVASIEERQGSWVLVTSTNQVVGISH